MSGSAGGNRIPRAAVEKTVQEYIQKVLSKFPSFRGAKISGSYNTGTKSEMYNFFAFSTVRESPKNWRKNSKRFFLQFNSLL